LLILFYFIFYILFILILYLGFYNNGHTAPLQLIRGTIWWRHYTLLFRFSFWNIFYIIFPILIHFIYFPFLVIFCCDHALDRHMCPIEKAPHSAPRCHRGTSRLLPIHISLLLPPSPRLRSRHTLPTDHRWQICQKCHWIIAGIVGTSSGCHARVVFADVCSDCGVWFGVLFDITSIGLWWFAEMDWWGV